jgi:hypothetical protein
MHTARSNPPGVSRGLARTGLPGLTWVLVAVVGLTAMPGHARFCAGDREPVLRNIEAAFRTATMNLNETETWIAAWGRLLLGQQAPRLAQFLSFSDLRGKLSALLETRPEATEEALWAVAAPAWRTARELALGFSLSNPLPTEADLREMLSETLWLFRACQAARASTPELCAQGAARAPQQDCADFLSKVFLLYRGRCSPEHAPALAALTGLPGEQALAACRILSAGQPAGCADLGLAGAGPAVCRALAARDPQICLTLDDEAVRQDCRLDVALLSLARGDSRPDDDLLHGALVPWKTSILLGAFTLEPCHDQALRQLDMVVGLSWDHVRAGWMPASTVE